MNAPAPIRRHLADFVAAQRRVRSLAAALRALAVVLAWTFASCIADRIWGLPGLHRTLLLAAEIVLVLSILLPPLARLIACPIDWLAAAEELEHRDPSLRQRLITVVSQWLSPEGHRGSPQILSVLSDDVSADLVRGSASKHVRWREAAKPALLLLPLLILWAGFWWTSWLNMPRLVQRHFMPWIAVGPVTTTILDVAPRGVIDVGERESLAVKATVQHLRGPGAPVLWTSTDGSNWSRQPMTPQDADHFLLMLPALEKDLRFHVEAGDARSPQTTVRVLRKPQLAEFRIRYLYPAYTRRGALAIQNTDGLIEAPHGTEAVLSIVATEPLSQAAVKLLGQRIEMTPGEQPNIRQATLSVTRDQQYEIDLVSDRGVAGKSARPMTIRAVPDRPPLVRVLAPATDLRLAPRDIVNVSWQALDDYGIAQATLEVQINFQTYAQQPLDTAGDPRRKEGVIELDLATLDLKIGDLVTLILRGEDTAGQKAADQPRNILISPRSIDTTTHRRISELAEAARQARQWATQLAQARQALDEARRLPPARSLEFSIAQGRISRQITAAQETGLVVRQSMLRSLASNASVTLADALAHALDTLVQQSDALARVDQSLGWGQSVDDPTANRLARSASSANEVAAGLKVLWEGEQAAAVQADLANLKASAPPTIRPGAPRPATRDSRKQMVDRAWQEITASLAEMGIKDASSSSSVMPQLQSRVEAARQYAASQPKPDFLHAARRWRDAIVNGQPHPPRLDERLYAASQAMALRADAELVGARDLNLSARAASALAERFTALRAEGTAPARPEKAALLDQCLEAFSALKAEHDVNLRAMRALPSEARQIHDQSRPIHARATEARAKMIEWAVGPDATADVIASRLRELEELAMSANAATATRDFDKAAELDRRLAATLNRPDLAEAARAPRAIDSITQSQETAADQVRRDPATAASAQEQVAGQLAQIPGAEPNDTRADTRLAATAAISAAQEKLASLPILLAAAQQAASGAQETSRRLESARVQAQAAPLEEMEAAQRVLRQVTDEMDAARHEFDTAQAAVSPRNAEEIAQSLRPYAPEAVAAVAAAEEHLRPALDELRKVLEHHRATGDRAGLETAMQSVRSAIQQTQDALRHAQLQIVERDPIVAARWFARAAADALAGQNPGLAHTHQQRTLESLHQAAIDALRRSRNLRLAEVPSFAPYYARGAGYWGDLDPRVAGERLLHGIPSLREWGRIRQRGADPITAPLRESEPPGFADSLRVYFEVLQKEESRATDNKPRNR